MDERTAHWDQVYSTKRDDEVSWFQQEPGLSLKLVRRCGLAAGAAVIDVGGGASRLADALLDAGLSVTVLDISAAALARSRERLGDRAGRVEWVVGDITEWTPPHRFELWHDRAVFHFLTDPADRAAYRERLAAGLRHGAFAVIGTFALDGPERCSGLPVMRYGPEELAEELGAGFRLIDSAREAHVTPAGKTQSFQFCRFTRV